MVGGGGKHRTVNRPSSTAVVAEDKPRSEEDRGGDGDEDLKEIRSQRLQDTDGGRERASE